MSQQPLAIISGASSGIGAATARLLGQNGWRVILVARNETALQSVAKDLPAGQSIVVVLDVSDGNAVDAAAAKIIAEHGVPDVVINSAGVGVWRFLEETTISEIEQMVNAPFLSAMYLSRAFMSAMLKRRRGQIIHINSPVSHLGWPGATGYMATRFALRGLHEALRSDLFGTGVKSTHLLFGKTRSPYFANNPGSEERLPGIAKLVREITPEQCARVVLKSIKSRPNEVIYPFMLKAFYLTNWIMPWSVRLLGIFTGRRHR